jgi:hypothetical protein
MQALATMTAANLTGWQDASPLVRHKRKKAQVLELVVHTLLNLVY